LALLQSAAPYEFGWKAQNWPAYGRGLAYLHSNRPKDAAAEFQRIIDHRGICMAGAAAPMVYALAHLQLARAQAQGGDKDAAQVAYRDFLNRWKDADQGISVLLQAKTELAKIK
jgi:hypothetical protein